jgi:hypothetical protein
VPVGTGAQELGERSRAVLYNDESVYFYTVDTVPHSARVVLDGNNRLAGPVPLAIPADIRGSYRLEATAKGYATQRARLIIPGGGQPVEILGPHGRIGLSQLGYTLVWPGLAANRDGDGLRGSGWMVSAIIGLGSTIASHLVLQNEIDELGEARQRYEDAAGWQEQAAAAIDIVEREAAANRAENARRDWAIVTGTVWGLSVIDRFLLSPRLGRADIGITDVTLELQPFSRAQAALRSLIPGQGQLYTRRSRAAALSIYGTMASGFGLLYAEQTYDEAVNRVAGIQALYDDPATDPETLDLLRPVLEEEVRRADSRRNARNIMVAVTAGVYALGIVDAYLGTPPVPTASAFDVGLRPTIDVGSGSHHEVGLGLAFAF